MLIFIVSVVSFIMAIMAVSTATVRQDLKEQQKYLATARVEQVKAAVVRDYRYFSDQYLISTYNNKKMFQGLQDMVNTTGVRNSDLRPLLRYQSDYLNQVYKYQAFTTHVYNTTAGPMDRRVLVYAPYMPGTQIDAGSTPTISQTQFTLAENNKCGTTSFYDGSKKWCGDSSVAAYALFNEREMSGPIDRAILEQLKATANTYRNSYLGGIAFPTTSGTLESLTTVIGSSTKLSSDTSTQCSGNFRHGPSIVLSCLDLYNQGIYNARVSYTYLNSKSIRLSATSLIPVKDTSGVVTYPPITFTLTMP
jgi:hypothetical protein